VRLHTLHEEIKPNPYPIRWDEIPASRFIDTTIKASPSYNTIEIAEYSDGVFIVTMPTWMVQGIKHVLVRDGMAFTEQQEITNRYLGFHTLEYDDWMKLRRKDPKDVEIIKLAIKELRDENQWIGDYYY
jgi:hypothetical protein